MRALIGRDEDLAAIDAVLRRCSSQGDGLLLLGEPGIGKSALLTAATRRAEAFGITRLTASGVEAEAQLPFAGLYQLLAPAFDAIAAIPAPEAEALNAAIGLADGPQPDPYLIASAVVELLRAVARSGPLAVLVDDAQWLDPPTQAALGFVARHLDAIPAALLVAVRTESAASAAPIAATRLAQRRIEALDAAAAAALLDATATFLPASERRRIQEEAAGNPLALLELPATWRREGDGDAAPTLSARLERDFGARVDDLPEATRDLLLVAAISDTTDAAEAYAAAGALVGRPVDARDLEPAVRAGLVRPTDGPIEFRHPLVRSGVVQAARVAQRQAAHGALALVVRDEPFRRAWHRAQAIVGPDDEVADELEATVAESLRRGAVMSAIASLERAARLTSGSALRGHRLLRAAEQAFGLGRADLVDRLVRDAEATSLTALDWARMQWLREIFSDGVPGDASRVLELCDAAVRAAAGGDTDLGFNLLLGAALRCWWADTGPAARAHVVDVASRLGDTTDVRVVAILAVAEPVLCARPVAEALSHRPVAGADVEELRLLGMAAHAIGDEARADEYLTECEDRLRAQKKLGLLAQTLSMHVIVSLELGDWDRAAATTEEGLRLAEDTGQPIWSVGTLACDAISSGLRGDVDRALALAAAVELDAGRQGLNDLLSCAQLARGLARLELGEEGQAYDELRRALRPADPSFHQRECFGSVMFLAEAAVAAGRTREARGVVEQLEQVATLTPAPILHHQLAYARAVLADGAAAEDLYRSALARDLTRWPWVRGRLELAFGTWLGSQGRAREGHHLVASALEVLEAIGASHWVRLAREELGRSGMVQSDADDRRMGHQPQGGR
jgi:tetratricopeptide (TPR) repeat protein